MISVQQASEIISEVPFRARTHKVSIGDATGRVLAEKIVADRDLPPFHRATMDGIAIRFDDFKKGQRKFIVEGTQAAGTPQLVLDKGCIEIMTGAMLPKNADTVIRYEDVSIVDGWAAVTIETVEEGQSIHRQGIDAVKNEVLLNPGALISSAEIAILASVGKGEVEVFNVNKIAVVSTGDELVEIEQTPLAYQVRRSNGVAIASALSAMKINAEVFHLPDNPEVLESELSDVIKKHDVIILSGGVSKGKFDYIPGVLEKLGIKKVFHQVKQRPGKPLWFGRGENKTVFALPGNPVSTFLCFHKYIKPWIENGLGLKSNDIKAFLATDYTFKPDLTYFLQVKLETSEGKLMAIPDAGEGSGDFANLRVVDGFIELPSERNEFRKGELFPFISFR